MRTVKDLTEKELYDLVYSAIRRSNGELWAGLRVRIKGIENDLELIKTKLDELVNDVKEKEEKKLPALGDMLKDNSELKEKLFPEYDFPKIGAHLHGWKPDVSLPEREGGDTE
jgi:hypothetical protein